MIDLSARLELALLRFRVREAVAAVLDALSVGERQAVLVDLLADYDRGQRAMASPELATPVPRISAEPAPHPASGVEPEDPASLPERLLGILRTHRDATIERLSIALFGSNDTMTKNRTSTTLSLLKRRGQAVSVARGVWRAAAALPRPRARRVPSFDVDGSANSVHATSRAHAMGLPAGDVRLPMRSGRTNGSPSVLNPSFGGEDE